MSRARTAHGRRPRLASSLRKALAICEEQAHIPLGPRIEALDLSVPEVTEFMNTVHDSELTARAAETGVNLWETAGRENPESEYGQAFALFRTKLDELPEDELHAWAMAFKDVAALGVGEGFILGVAYATMKLEGEAARARNTPRR